MTFLPGEGPIDEISAKAETPDPSPAPDQPVEAPLEPTEPAAPAEPTEPTSAPDDEDDSPDVKQDQQTG